MATKRSSNFSSMSGTMICRICENTSNNEIYQVKEMMLGSGDVFTYFQCSQCECVQLEDLSRDISAYYKKGYYSFESTPPHRPSSIKRFALNLRDNYAVFGRGLVGRFLFRRFPRYDMQALVRCDLSKSSRILDIGCGAGLLLSSLADLGFTELLGIDPYIDVDKEQQVGPKIIKSNIFDLEEKWDLIMFHHSFEHVQDPRRMLRYVSGLLSDRGICLIRIPVVPCYAWEHYRTNWAQLDAPRHTHIFSVKGVGILADDAELSVEKVMHDSTEFQFWASEQYLEGIPLMSAQSYLIDPARSIFDKAQIKRFRKRSIRLNREGRGDQAVFYLKKMSG